MAESSNGLAKKPVEQQQQQQHHQQQQPTNHHQQQQQNLHQKTVLHHERFPNPRDQNNVHPQYPNHHQQQQQQKIQNHPQLHHHQQQQQQQQQRQQQQHHQQQQRQQQQPRQQQHHHHHHQQQQQQQKQNLRQHSPHHPHHRNHHHHQHHHHHTKDEAASASSKRRTTVLIAMDGSPHSFYAFDWYMSHIHQPHNDVIVVHSSHPSHLLSCSEPLLPSVVDAPHSVKSRLVSKEEEEVNRIAHMIKGKLTANGVRGKLVRLTGEPGPTIVELANENKAACIVTGSRGMGTIKRALIGSVSDYVLHHATCPVLVCRHKEQQHTHTTSTSGSSNACHNNSNSNNNNNNA